MRKSFKKEKRSPKGCAETLLFSSGLYRRCRNLPCSAPFGVRGLGKQSALCPLLFPDLWILSKKSEWIFWTNAPKTSFKTLKSSGHWAVFAFVTTGVEFHQPPKYLICMQGTAENSPRIRHRLVCHRTLLQKAFIHKVFFDFALRSSAQPLAPNLLWKFRDTLFFPKPGNPGNRFSRQKCRLKGIRGMPQRRHPSFLKITR